MGQPDGQVPHADWDSGQTIFVDGGHSLFGDRT
jgi:hypothetical protein